MTSITVCSKSAWSPPNRREHAFARQALAHGIEVTFIEPPVDARSVLEVGAVAFARGARGRVLPGPPAGLTAVTRSAPVPGHRNRVAEVTEAILGRWVLHSHAADGAPSVTNLPWHWGATAGQARRVFDCADDWTRLYPEGRRQRMLEQFRRVADEADEVIVASPDLAHLFPGRQPVHVPNGAEVGDVAERPTPRPDRRTAVYVGTMSERFDVPTVAQVLRELPDWSLDIYGPCRYSGLGDQPSGELQTFLASFAGRARFHGPIPRSAVASAIDAADVTLVPNVPHLSVGQSSMKMFDSAARGRPAVVAHGVTSDGDGLPPSTVVAATTDEWVTGILGCVEEPAGLAQERIDWARANTWEHRWPAWSRAVFGAMPGSGPHR